MVILTKVSGTFIFQTTLIAVISWFVGFRKHFQQAHARIHQNVTSKLTKPPNKEKNNQNWICSLLHIFQAYPCDPRPCYPILNWWFGHYDVTWNLIRSFYQCCYFPQTITPATAGATDSLQQPLVKLSLQSLLRRFLMATTLPASKPGETYLILASSLGTERPGLKSVRLKGKLGEIFLLAQSFYRPQTKTSFKRQFSPKSPKVGQKSG